MRKYKIVAGGYILCIGIGYMGTPISDEEYGKILDMLQNSPVAPEGWAYRLTEGLQWELYELPAADPDPELTAEEALDIILGGGCHATI